MIKIIKKKINMSDELKAKINWSCKFNNRPYQIIAGHLRIVEHTNLAHIEPHKAIINNIMFLVFNYSNDVYIKNFGNKIKINELENYLKCTN